ncbi:MAG: signal peptide peptidase SppA [Flavobacteriaceae bacterium]
MPLDAQEVVDRRRLTRRLSRWRFAALALVVLFVLGVAGVLARDQFGAFGGEQVARVQITGLITGDRKTLDLIDRIGKNDNIRALILSIDSPGGTTAGSEELFNAVRKVAARKPVVAELGTLAASGGYIAAISADRIFARRNTLTGSIGVIFQWANVTRLLDNVGVSFSTVKSAPLKAEPNPFTPENPEAVAAMRVLVEDSFNWFVDLVADRRGMEETRARQLADGRLYTGKQALENGLIDEIGGDDEVRAWLEKEHGIGSGVPVRDLAPDAGFAGISVQAVARFFGMERLAAMLAAPQTPISGLVAVWEPQMVDR